MVGPVTVSVKVLFQEACRLKSCWDDPLQGKLKQGVEDLIKGLIDCQQITIQRCVYDHVSEEVLECSLHGFAAASEKAYYAVIYVVCRTTVRRYISLLTSKTRVTSLKELSIPRLELMAAIILVKLMSTVETALITSLVSVKQTKLWLGSMTALYWIINWRSGNSLSTSC